MKPIALLTIAVLAGVPATLSAQEKVAEKKGTPRAVCENPVWDFGVQPQFAELDHEYTIRNGGTAPLRILRVIPTCQCAAGMPAKNELAPGESTAIKATMKTLSFEGVITKVIQVVTDDPIDPNLKLTIKGDVTPAYTVVPKEVTLGTVGKKDESAAGEFAVVVAKGMAVQVTGVTATDPHVSVVPAGDPEVLADGRLRQRYAVKLLPGLPVGQVREEIIVATSDRTRAQARVVVSASVQGEVLVRPRTFNLGKVKKGESVARDVEIEKSGAADLEIQQVSVVDNRGAPNENFAVELVAEEPGKRFKIKLTLKPTAAPGYHRGSVLLHTNVPGETVHQAYFYVYVTS